MKADEKIEKQLYQIVQRIIEARFRKGYKPETMAIELRISKTAYYDIESGKTNITLKRLYQIAEILDVSLLSLIEGEQKTNKEECSACRHYQKNETLYQQRHELSEENLKSKNKLIEHLEKSLDELMNAKR